MLLELEPWRQEGLCGRLSRRALELWLGTPVLWAAAILVVGLVSGPAVGAREITVHAAGDVARCGHASALATGLLLDRLEGPILGLGDLAYERGSLNDYRHCFAPAWGRHRDRIHPATGNHDYGTPDAAGYFDYWKERAGEPGKGYYSFDLGDWHLIALNSSIEAGPGSPQIDWLGADLAATGKRCILAFWHHPYFSTAKHGPGRRMREAFRALDEAGATLVLSGHDHVYERFAPQNVEGAHDPQGGIRSFTVGTGGAQLYPFKSRSANSEFRFNRDWGVLSLTLEAEGYRWAFVTVAGETIDSGSGDCVARP